MSSPKMVIELARHVRKAIGPERTLMVDVGYLFHDVPTAARVCRQLAELDVFFFETPLPVDVPAVDVPEAYSRLAALSPIPLAMGEHGVTRWEFREMVERGGVQVVQPYMTTCGGLSEAKRIVEMARERGVLVCPGNWSTQILGAATVHLAAYSPITPFIEFAPAEVYASPLRQALQDAGFPVRDGAISLADRRPGIGYELPDDIRRRFALSCRPRVHRTGDTTREETQT
jgi:L-alanine-DL-glutamate epimerase-like enolase superfamily enzyme